VRDSAAARVALDALNRLLADATAVLGGPRVVMIPA